MAVSDNFMRSSNYAAFFIAKLPTNINYLTASGLFWSCLNIVAALTQVVTNFSIQPREKERTVHEKNERERTNQRTGL